MLEHHAACLTTRQQAELLHLESAYLSLQGFLFARGPPGVLVFDVTLNAVLLIVLLLGLLGDYAAVLIDRVLELAVVLGLGD